MSDDYLPRKAPTGKTANVDQSTLDMEAVLQLPAGRRTIMRLLEMSGLYRNAYAGEREATDFRLGEQNMGLRIVAMIEQVGPTQFPRLLLERAQEQDKDEVHVVDADE